MVTKPKQVTSLKPLDQRTWERELSHDIECLRELLEVRQEIITTRLDAMDKGIVLLQAFTDRQPTTAAVASSVDALEVLMLEKFGGVAMRFQERDIRQEQSAIDTKLAIDTALAAAKELGSEQNRSNTAAVTKSELGFTNQLVGLTGKIDAAIKSLEDRINDQKDRITIIESNTKGENRGVGLIGNIIMGAIAMLALVISGAAILMKL